MKALITAQFVVDLPTEVHEGQELFKVQSRIEYCVREGALILGGVYEGDPLKSIEILNRPNVIVHLIEEAS